MHADVIVRYCAHRQTNGHSSQRVTTTSGPAAPPTTENRLRLTPASLQPPTSTAHFSFLSLSLFTSSSDLSPGVKGPRTPPQLSGGTYVSARTINKPSRSNMYRQTSRRQQPSRICLCSPALGARPRSGVPPPGPLDCKRYRRCPRQYRRCASRESARAENYRREQERYRR